MSQKNSQSILLSALAGTAVGLLLGAGSALFFTSKRGKQLRKNLSRQYQNLSDKTQEIVNEYNFNHTKPPGRKKFPLTSRRTSTARKALKKISKRI